MRGDSDAISVGQFKRSQETRVACREEERLAEIDRLKRKYGDSIETIIASVAQMRDKLERLQGFDAPNRCR